MRRHVMAIPIPTIPVSRRDARLMAIAVSGVQYQLREVSSVLFALAERLGQGNGDSRDARILQRMYEIIQSDAEHLNPVNAFLAHLVRETTRAQALVKWTEGA
jgi:hypothetical protein